MEETERSDRVPEPDFARGLDDEVKKAAAKRRPDYARGLHREKEQGKHT